MYAHRIVTPLTGLTVKIDLPVEFTGCKAAEVIVMPMPGVADDSWRDQVLARAGLLGADFPDDIDDSDLAVEAEPEPLVP